MRSTEVIVKTLERVADEWQTHFGRFLDLFPGGDSLVPQIGSVVCLVDLVGREIRSIGSRLQARFERSANTAKTIEFNTSEKCVALDLLRPTPSESHLGIADETETMLVNAKYTYASELTFESSVRLRRRE